MIGQAYVKLEQAVESIDQKISTEFERAFKNHFANKYENLSKCLDGIEKYDEKTVRRCNEEAKANELSFTQDLAKEKELLYQCIDSGYQKYVIKGDIGKSKETPDELFMKSFDVCLKKFETNASNILRSLMEKKSKQKSK